MEKFLKYILGPIKENLWFFLDIWLLCSAADWWYWSIHGNPVFGGYMACHGLIMTYSIVLISQLFRGIISTILKSFLLFLGIINLISDSLVHNTMHFSFTQDMVAIILGSNISEASEFLLMYFTSNVICFICVVLSIAFLLWFFRKKYEKYIKTWMSFCVLGVILLATSIIVIRKSNNWEGLFLCKIKTFLTYKKPKDLRMYRTIPTIIPSDNQPDNIVLIIGESLSINHCSLYGYEKQTQPCLEKMLNDSLINVLYDVESAYPNTTESFKAIMSTYMPSNRSKEWYSEETFLFDMIKSAGYHTYWISNQSSVGIYDNVVAAYAQLADSTIWVGTKGMGIGKHDLDELTLPVVKSIASLTHKKFIVVHLMGSHEGFDSRYPQAYAKFSPADYQDKPENQRYILSSYDNSIYYNDYIVSELFKIFIRNDKNLIIYFPDHGLDIFDTDPEYAGHARPTIPESFKMGVSIPFIVSHTYSSIDLANTGNIYDYMLTLISK